MSKLLEIFSDLFFTSVQVYTWHRISGNKTLKLNFKTILVILILICFSLFNFKNEYELIKPLLLILVSVFCCKFLLNESFKNSIIVIFCQYLIVIILEAVLVFFALFFLDNDVILNNTIVSGIVDIIMGILMIIIVNTKLFKRFYSFIIRHVSNLKNYEIMIFLLMVIICSITVFALTYFNNNIFIAIIINIIITIIYAAIVLVIIRIKNNYISVTKKYNTSLDNLQAQESIIDEYRIMNHENRNNLNTIKSITKEKKVISYINSLIKQSDELKSKIITDMLKIPEGGIRGLIYSKILTMQNNKIQYYLNIDKNISPKILSDIDDYDIVDICQILGVFIDNAIDELKVISEKKLTISFYLYNKKLFISIVNSLGETSKNNLSLKSTKGNGRGYGLKLVKKIIEKNPHLENEREFGKDFFNQKLIVKLWLQLRN